MAMPIAPSAHVSTSARRVERAMRLEGMFEPQERNEAFAAERQIQARDEGLVAVDPESDSVRHVHIAKRQIAPIEGHRAGVDEQRAIERPPRLPSVLGGQ